MASKGQFQTVLGVARIGAMLIGAASVTVGVGKLAVPLYQHLVFTAFPAAWAGFRSLLAPQYLFLLVNLIILIIWKLSEKRTPEHNLQHFRQEPGVVSTGTTTTTTPVQPKIVHASPDVVAVPSPKTQHVPPPLPSYSYVDNAMPSPRKPAAAPMYIHAQQTLPQPPPKPAASVDEASQPRVATPRNHSHNRRPPSPDTNSDDSCVTAEDDSSMEYHSPEPINSPLVRHRRLAAIATPARSAPVSPYHPTFGGGGGPEIPADAPESLEDAWRAITRSGAATPRMRKNETWGVAPRVVQMQPPPPARREMRKSETFNDAAATRRRAAGAPTQGVAWDRTERDEMNQKFEAFIKKMNDDLRMQRQESAAQRKIDTTLRRGY